MIEFFIKGGPLLYPIVFCSILALGIFLERLWVFARVRRGAQELAKKVENHLFKDEKAEAIALCEVSKNPLGRIILTALNLAGKPRDRIKQEVEEIGELETLVVNRYLGLLSTIATISPLLGLLGTVIGMIQAFNVIAVQGVGTPATLGVGISQALITTAAGLSVAIPAILLHRYLASRAGLLIVEIEEHSLHIVNIISK
ncbi:MAG: MotA/TolQ/ExbB proton channel family protein [Deltaproteobacteria bacterium]|nr:MotA/TolQ/ExbB proton channel family protein [Deltaproteobacteria bacterium]